MTKRLLRSLLLLLAITTQAAEVLHDGKVVLSYRAQWAGDYLVIRAAIEPGWHTFVMDNEQRQKEKLKGKPSLGIEKSTEITVEGLSATGPWLQSEPKDFSKPELRWYSWGFERDAVFATKAKRAGQGPAKVGIKGQACSGDICKNIDVELTVASDKQASGWDLKSLIPVR